SSGPVDVVGGRGGPGARERAFRGGGDDRRSERTGRVVVACDDRRVDVAADVPAGRGEVPLGEGVIGEVDQLGSGRDGVLPLSSLAAERVIGVGQGGVSRVGAGEELPRIVVPHDGGAPVGIHRLGGSAAAVVAGGPSVAGRVGDGRQAGQPVV